MDSKRIGYIVAALVGAAGGRLVMLFVTDAIPKMMKRMMAGMFENIRTQMGASGCEPQEM
ncbi:MAG TPA: hypothetical protein VLD65_08665 [Anaerolineales bacterium]|nr:hypothetical protein [Anaerolineales bacterium]